MTAEDRGQPVEVALEGCRCPGTPHPHDIVYLAPHLSSDMGYAALGALNGAGNSAARRTAALGKVWRELGIVGWSFLDGEGKGVPITVENLDEYLPWGDGGFTVAQKADDLYSGELLAPLAQRSPNSSPDGRMESSTSANSESSPQPLKPSKPSSPDATDGKPSEDAA